MTAPVMRPLADMQEMIGVSGRVPRIPVVVGPAAGGAAYGPATTDIVIMAPAGRVFVTGPGAVRNVTGEQIDMEGLGGTDTHGRRSGMAHVVASSENDAFERARRLTGSLARPGLFDLGAVQDEQALAALLPGRPRRAYDVCPLVRAIRDSDQRCHSVFEELQARWAANVVVGLGRLGGRVVGGGCEQPVAQGRVSGLAVDGENVMFRPDMRFLRGAVAGACRRFRVSAWCRRGVGWRGSAWCQAVARFFRSPGTPGDLGGPQVLWRGSYRHEHS